MKYLKCWKYGCDVKMRYGIKLKNQKCPVCNEITDLVSNDVFDKENSRVQELLRLGYC